MAIQVQQFLATIPAGTPQSAPAVTPMALGTFEIEWIEVEVPAGVNGEAGFYIASSGQQVVPFNSGTSPRWVVTNGRVFHWDLTGQPNSGDWSLVGYNVGTYPHTFLVHFGLAPVGATVTVLATIPAADLSTLATG